ncbi:hypothetical protein LSH36_193g14009 [Paralvinella palmiformis]|uniref:Uncharacterized protein n=1 Tax=Paralvinella palmiformis TaxID=53620 RepID=A0AAD9JRQ0_9ANNE|nr:hypothetical protein LSH36_193g14009 [Paralvinella palmiformis]
MPDTCDLYPTSDEQSTRPEAIAGGANGNSEPRTRRWDADGTNQRTANGTRSAEAHAPHAMMSEACTQSGYPEIRTRVDPGTALSRTPQNERWVSFNKEVLQNILENTIRIQMGEHNPGEGSNAGRRDGPPEGDADGRTMYASRDASSVEKVDDRYVCADSDSEDESINVTSCDDEDFRRSPGVGDTPPGVYQTGSTGDPVSASELVVVPVDLGRDDGRMRRDYATSGSCGGRDRSGSPEHDVSRLGRVAAERPSTVRSGEDGRPRGEPRIMWGSSPTEASRAASEPPVEPSLVCGERPRAAVSSPSSTSTERGTPCRQQQQSAGAGSLGTAEPLPPPTTTTPRPHNNPLSARSDTVEPRLCRGVMTVENANACHSIPSSAELGYGRHHQIGPINLRAEHVTATDTIGSESGDGERATMNGAGCRASGESCACVGVLDACQSKKNIQVCSKLKMAPGHQHWVRISKAAIEDILDELVVSSISDDSGSESRSQTPSSELGDSPDGGAKSERDKSSKSTQDKEEPVASQIGSRNSSTKCKIQTSASVIREELGQCQEHSENDPDDKYSSLAPVINSKDIPISPGGGGADPDTASPDTKVPEGISTERHAADDSAEKGVPEENHQKQTKNGLAVNEVVNVGWTVVNKPLISGDVDRALARELSPEVDCRPDTEMNSGSLVTSSKTVIGSKKANPDTSKVGEGTGQEKSNDLKVEGVRVAVAPDPGSLITAGPWNNPATALLLGALCMGEHKKVCKLASQNSARINKRASSSTDCGPSAKSTRPDLHCVGMDLRLSKRSDKTEHVPPEESRPVSRHSPSRDKITSSRLLAQDKKLPTSSTPKETKILGGSGSTTARDLQSRKVIASPSRATHMTVSGRGSDVMTTVYPEIVARPADSHVISLVTQNGSGTSSNSLDDPSNSCSRTTPNQQRLVVVEEDPDYLPKATDFSARTGKTAAITSKVLRSERLFPNVPNKSSRRNTKANQKTRKEPRCGWIVVSKDEVHTIMDSLTSQLFVDDHTAENDVRKASSAADVRLSGRSVSNAVGTLPEVLKNRENQLNKEHRQPSAERSRDELATSELDDLKQQRQPTVIETEVVAPPSLAALPRDDELQTSEDDDFRRTAIDALKAVYNHEDGLEGGNKSFSEQQQLQQQKQQQQQQQQLQYQQQAAGNGITVVPLSNQSLSGSEDVGRKSNLVGDRQSEADDSSRLMTIERHLPVTRPTYDKDHATSTVTGNSSGGSATGRPTTSDSSPDPERASRGFKWKSSILARVLDGLDTGDVTGSRERRRRGSARQVQATFGEQPLKQTTEKNQ